MGCCCSGSPARNSHIYIGQSRVFFRGVSLRCLHCTTPGDGTTAWGNQQHFLGKDLRSSFNLNGSCISEKSGLCGRGGLGVKAGERLMGLPYPIPELREAMHMVHLPTTKDNYQPSAGCSQAFFVIRGGEGGGETLEEAGTFSGQALLLSYPYPWGGGGSSQGGRHPLTALSTVPTHYQTTKNLTLAQPADTGTLIAFALGVRTNDLCNTGAVQYR